MLNIAICDDNSYMLSKIQNIVKSELEKHNETAKIQIFTNGEILLKAHETTIFDVLFLDIEMPSINGFDIAKKLRDSFSSSYLIFITVHSELVYNSLDFQPFNFIRKNDIIPIEVKISEILQKLLLHTRQNKKIIIENEGKSGNKHSVFIRDILYIESAGHYCKFFTKGETSFLKQRCTIQECEGFYSAYNFIRVHRSYIINLRHLDVLDLYNREIFLNDCDRPIPLGRKYKEYVDEKYTLYLRTII